MKARDIQKAWITAALADGRPNGKTQKGLAQTLGLDPSQGHRIAMGQRLLDFSEIALVENYLGARAPRGMGSTGDPIGDDLVLRDPARTFGEAGFVNVPLFKQRIPPGTPKPPQDLKPIGVLKFPEAMLKELAEDTHGLFAIEIAGDAGRPFLSPGDHALIDPARTNPARGGRYAIRVDDEMQVRLITMNPGSRALTVRADNPDYPGYDTIARSDLDIIGRVICISRRLV